MSDYRRLQDVPENEELPRRIINNISCIHRWYRSLEYRFVVCMSRCGQLMPEHEFHSGIDIKRKIQEAP